MLVFRNLDAVVDHRVKDEVLEVGGGHLVEADLDHVVAMNVHRELDHLVEQALGDQLGPLIVELDGVQ